MTLTQTIYPNRIAFSACKKRVHSAEIGSLAAVLKKSTTELKHKQNLLKCKSTIHVATFNIRTLSGISQLLEVTVSVVEQNKDIVCIQEHRYHHSEVVIKYCDTGNGLMFVPASVWINSVNVIVGGVGMIFGPLS